MTRHTRTEPQNADRKENSNWKIYLQYLQKFKKAQWWLEHAVVNRVGNQLFDRGDMETSEKDYFF